MQMRPQLIYRYSKLIKMIIKTNDNEGFRNATVLKFRIVNIIFTAT